MERPCFLTGLTDEELQKKPHFVSLDVLMGCVFSIDSHFKRVLVTHENDFMSAYQGHMTKVKKELQFLKSKAEKAAGELSNDDTVTNL